MSSPARRKEKQAQYDRELTDRVVEQARKDSLDMWERIEESDASADVKDILHRLAAKMGMEEG